MGPLWDEFTPATLEAWQAAAAKETKGRSLEQLAWTTPDGLHLEPIYLHTPVDGTPPADPSGGQNAAALAIRQDFTLNEVAGLNPDELASLQLDWLGLQLQDREEQRWPEMTCSKILLSGSSFNLHRALRSGVQPGAVELDLWQEFLAPAFMSVIPQPTRVWLSTASLQGAGATPVQELGYGLASWVWQLRQLREEQSGRLDWVVGVSSNLLTEIAKLRAARQLWRRAYQAFGWSVEGQIQAVQSRLTWSTLDAHTNILRSASAAIAASCGGAASLRLEPFSEGSELARRLARNQIRVIELEGYLGQVRDPLAGSRFLESYTDQLARGAWALMQECEAQGGMPLYRDTALAAVEKSRLERVARLASNSDCLVGVNRYAVSDGFPVARPLDWRLASSFEEARAVR